MKVLLNKITAITIAATGVALLLIAIVLHGCNSSPAGETDTPITESEQAFMDTQ